MKFKFKKQQYQTNAVESVADCFAGQPKNTGIQYRIDPGRVAAGAPQQREMYEEGFKTRISRFRLQRYWKTFTLFSAARICRYRPRWPATKFARLISMSKWKLVPARLIATSKPCLN